VELSVTSRQEGARTVIAVGGEIDVYTAPSLRERLNELVAAGHYDLVVDMEKVEFLDSTGLGVLVGALKRLRGVGGELFLACGQERLLKIFRITGLDRVFTMFGSVEAATASGHTGSGAGTPPGGDADGGPDAAGSVG
jgi:anti-sigma B factor antagonist